jgi:uncharacterized protein (DUF885 family)
MPKRLTVASVVADANTARQALAELERELQEDIDEIDFTAFKEERDLTAKEIERRKERRATQGEVRDGFRILAFVTAQRLDDSAEVSQLLRQLQIVNAGLEDDLAQLEDIKKFAAISAQVADALAKTAANLAKVAASGLV